jgi:hypothetical protein
MHILSVVPGWLLWEQAFLVAEHSAVVSVREALASRYAIKRRLQIDRALQHIPCRTVRDFHAVDEACLASYPLCDILTNLSRLA